MSEGFPADVPAEGGPYHALIFKHIISVTLCPTRIQENKNTVRKPSNALSGVILSLLRLPPPPTTEQTGPPSTYPACPSPPYSPSTYMHTHNPPKLLCTSVACCCCCRLPAVQQGQMPFHFLVFDRHPALSSVLPIPPLRHHTHIQLPSLPVKVPTPNQAEGTRLPVAAEYFALCNLHIQEP